MPPTIEFSVPKSNGISRPRPAHCNFIDHTTEPCRHICVVSLDFDEPRAEIRLVTFQFLDVFNGASMGLLKDRTSFFQLRIGLLKE